MNIQKTYIGVLKDSSIENHTIDPIDFSQCSYLSGEILSRVRLSHPMMRRGSTEYINAGIGSYIAFKELTSSHSCAACECPKLRSFFHIPYGGQDVVTSSEKLAHPFKSNASTCADDDPDGWCSHRVSNATNKFTIDKNALRAAATDAQATGLVLP